MKILYEDVTIENLTRLPVKSLIRFKCICKFWCTLINSPSFISRHLKNYNDENARLFVEYNTFGFEGQRFALFSDETLTDLSSYQVFKPQISKDHDDWAPFTCGPYKGLFCIYTPSCIDLWNPATRELRPLPKCNIELIDIFEIGIQEVVWNVGIGFELDPVSNDYNMVFIFELCNNASTETGPYLHSHIALYTLSTDSWRYSKIDD
ncbi:F-box protein At4g19940-like [Citrus sinensis]|uniref:F-box protein At4g19940-like n=1 Tax=Citrus sinensis TaxID=2711 RepID=UPI00227761D5|nr:F-box protein At4g19940-like [Citrus sinensis]